MFRWKRWRMLVYLCFLDFLLRFGDGDRFDFLFFFVSTSDDDVDEFELERDDDDDDDDEDRARFDGFLFFFDFTGTGLLFVDVTDFLSDELFAFLCERSGLEFDEERWGGFSFALLAAEELEEERCLCLSFVRDGLTGLRLCEGDFEGERRRFEDGLGFSLR